MSTSTPTLGNGVPEHHAGCGEALTGPGLPRGIKAPSQSDDKGVVQQQEKERALFTCTTPVSLPSLHEKP